MKPEELWSAVQGPGDAASWFIGCVRFYGSSTIPQQVIDYFQGHFTRGNTQVGQLSGMEFKVTGSYLDGQQVPPPNAFGTVSVDNFGVRVRDKHGHKQFWVDFTSQGDDRHKDMHYQEPGWPNGERVSASKEPERFRENLQKWQSPAFTDLLRRIAGNESCLYDLGSGC
jgi:hypothetical protein